MRAEPRVIDFRERPGVKTYRNHNCERKHRNETTFMECALGKRVAWVSGVGHYASISWCNGRGYRSHYATVLLFETIEEALGAKGCIDSNSCGGGCENKHQVVRIEKGN